MSCYVIAMLPAMSDLLPPLHRCIVVVGHTARHFIITMHAKSYAVRFTCTLLTTSNNFLKFPQSLRLCFSEFAHV